MADIFLSYADEDQPRRPPDPPPARAVHQAAAGRGNRRAAQPHARAGQGSQESLVGTGTDDARDALDRRVEFKVVGC